MTSCRIFSLRAVDFFRKVDVRSKLLGFVTLDGVWRYFGRVLGSGPTSTLGMTRRGREVT